MFTGMFDPNRFSCVLNLKLKVTSPEDRFRHPNSQMGNYLSSQNCTLPPTLPPRSPRTFTQLHSHNPATAFRLLTYNILAPGYSRTQAAYCPPQHLDWEARKWRVLQELEALNADVLALQEVEAKDFHRFFSPALQARGFQGQYVQKKGSIDGVAVFWRTSTFRKTRSSQIILQNMFKFSPETPNLDLSSKMLFSMLRSLETVALFVQLESNAVPGEQLWVCCVHLHWDPGMPEVKALQMGAVLQHAQTLMASDARLVVCGDFNSLPTKTVGDVYDVIAPGETLVSGVYHLALNQDLPIDHPHHPCTRRQLSLSPSDPSFKLYSQFLSNPFKFRSAMKEVYGCEPDCTNFTSTFNGTLDYIFVTERGLEVTGAGDLPTKDELRREVAIPDSVYPSDHLAIVSDLNLVV